MGATLAPNPDQQRLLVVHAFREPVRPFGKKSVRCALEEQKRRSCLQLGIVLEQLSVPRFERRKVLLLFLCELLKNAPSPRVLRNPRRARIELESATLGCDGNAQRIPREYRFRRATLSGRTAGLALLACTVDLHDALLGGEVARGRDFLNQCFDVGAEELE
jgi:hypothetical protein